MSEYQYVAFRAIDKPVSQKNLEYMEQQSSRAEITPWSFDNEYNFGDFRGNSLEMMRRGYDLHLHYANFGIRKLLIRLPHGFPDPRAAQPYLGRELLGFAKDKRGPGGTLTIEPSHEPGDLDEIWDFEEWLDGLSPLRGEILEGDLRPLYLAHLAVADDGDHDPEETIEGPVPAGLGQLTSAQKVLAEFFGLSTALLAAAAAASAALPKQEAKIEASSWISAQPKTYKDAWLTRLIADPDSDVRVEILSQYRQSCVTVAWPTIESKRTLAELHTAAEGIQQKQNLKAAAKVARERAKRLAKLAKDPAACLREADKLVAQRTTKAFQQAGELLTDLREALAGSDAEDLPERYAARLKQANPKLNRLTGELRRRGFIPK